LDFKVYERIKSINSDEPDKFEIKLTDKKKAEFAHVFYPKNLDDNMPVYFCVKQQNKRKLNSHLWYFGGFCKVFDPKYCMLVDAGTEPEEKSLFYLYKALEKSDKIDRDSVFDVLCYAQKVEYKFSHILDKSLESVFGFITVLPGAFSGYRLEALEVDNPDGPLWGDYFMSLKKPWAMDCYHANIYLAEDRVLCLALVSNGDYLLKYVSQSKAYTDPPQDFASLLSQRRRWINGSWFALLHSIRHWDRVWKSNHPCWRKSLFTLQLIYYLVNVLYSFIMVGGFYLALSICLREQLTSTVTPGQRSGVGDAIITFYLLLLILIIILSLGSKSNNIETTLKFVSSIFSIYMILFLVLVVRLFFENLGAFAVWVPVILTIAGFVLILILNNTVWQVFLGCLQFIVATPTYMNIFTIYSICNIHDCSWGNRPGEMTQEERDKMDDFEKFRMSWVLLWALCNGYFSYFFDAADASKTSYSLFIYVVGLTGLSALYVRFIGGILYVLIEKCPSCRNDDNDSNNVGENNH
jgi:chitin synthase